MSRAEEEISRKILPGALPDAYYLESGQECFVLGLEVQEQTWNDLCVSHVVQERLETLK